jgi:hypothetical protein
MSPLVVELIKICVWPGAVLLIVVVPSVLLFRYSLKKLKKILEQRKDPAPGPQTSNDIPNEKLMVSTKEIYSGLVQLTIHAETITWNRFNNFLVGNTILVLAWATIFASDNFLNGKTFILAALCILGAISGPFWAALGERGRKFLDEYIDLAVEIEKSKYFPNQLYKYKQFTITKNKIHTLPYGWAGSRYILRVWPLIFTLLYIVLLIVSLRAYIFS